ncbi:2-hydroxychromene-2-carboxylate isomerase [Bradyrhizobium diazoefficiens]
MSRCDRPPSRRFRCCARLWTMTIAASCWRPSAASAVVLDVVHGLTAPRFGRRNATPKKLSSEDRARKVLGLPLAVQLTCDDINQAYRRAAKGMHPDRGGSAEAFIDLAAARDLLIHPGAHKDAWERSDEIS